MALTCIWLPLFEPGSTRGVVPGGGSIRDGKWETGVRSCECRFSGWRAKGGGEADDDEADAQKDIVRVGAGAEAGHWCQRGAERRAVL